VSADNWARCPKCEDLIEDNFREDYEIGVDDEGAFEVIYTGQCRVCGFKFDFKHKEFLGSRP
jgi:xanthine dehydrogenase molybdopterin-binding subunit B